MARWGWSARGRMLYGKVAPLADCARLPLTGEQQRLCDPRPTWSRPGPNWYTWSPASPAAQFDRTSATADALYRGFAVTTIRHQLGEYARAVLTDLALYAAPRPMQRHGAARLVTWQFPTGPTPPWTVTLYGPRTPPSVGIPEVSARGALPLRLYQQVAFTPGPLLVLSGVLALVAAAMRDGVGARRRVRRSECLLLAVVGLILVLIPAMTVALDYRFRLPELVVLPIAAALALNRIRDARRQRRSPAAVEPSG